MPAAPNPALGKAGGAPESAIVPRTLGGAGAITTNPTTIGQKDRLANYLFTKSQQQYEARLRTLASAYGWKTEGRLTDPVTLDALKQRSIWAANSIQQTAAKDVKASADPQQTVFQARNQYKPQQIFTTEVNTADQKAFRDFYDKNPDLAATAMGHVEPTDAEEEECMGWIEAGSLPIDQFPDFPLHVGCSHTVEPDAPDLATTTLSVPGDDGQSSSTPLIQIAAQQLMSSAAVWLGGMIVTATAADL